MPEANKKQMATIDIIITNSKGKKITKSVTASDAQIAYWLSQVELLGKEERELLGV